MAAQDNGQDNGTVPDPRAAASFARQGMMETLGAQMLRCAEGQCEIAAPIDPAFGQQHGFAHAGMTFALGDSAAGYAALSVLPADREVVTAEMKINLMAPAEGDRLLAEGRVLRAGRRLISVQADVFAFRNGTRTHVACLLGTIVAVPVRNPA